MITEPLQILMVEDNPSDSTLIKREISKIAENATIKLCNNLRDFELAVTNLKPDLILSDYNLRRYHPEWSIRVYFKKEYCNAS